MTESPQCSSEMPMEMAKGLRWRVAVTIVAGVGWLIFLILWLGFFAGDYTGYENLAIFLVSILVVAAIIAPMWAIWGMKMRPPSTKAE